MLRTWGSRKQVSSEFINAPTFCDLKSLYMASACALTALSLDIRHFKTSDIDIMISRFARNGNPLTKKSAFTILVLSVRMGLVDSILWDLSISCP